MRNTGIYEQEGGPDRALGEHTALLLRGKGGHECSWPDGEYIVGVQRTRVGQWPSGQPAFLRRRPLSRVCGWELAQTRGPDRQVYVYSITATSLRLGRCFTRQSIALCTSRLVTMLRRPVRVGFPCRGALASVVRGRALTLRRGRRPTKILLEATASAQPSGTWDLALDPNGSP